MFGQLSQISPGVRGGILLIEGDRLRRLSLRHGLRSQGLAVWAAKDGRVALDLFPAVQALVDVILCDVHIPRFGWKKILQALRETDPQVRVCLMAPKTSRMVREQLLSEGALQVFERPVRPRPVARVLKTLCKATPWPRTNRAVGHHLPSIESVWNRLFGLLGGLAP